MKKLLLHAFLLFFLLPGIQLSGQKSKTDPRLKNLDKIVQQVLKDWKAPGCAIAIVEKQKVIYTGGFGYRDLENKLPATGNTLYDIGSSTKAFTCSLIGVLADEKKIDLDKPASRYLPSLRFSDPLLTLQVTPRDMMCHRTGLPRHDFAWYGAPDLSRDSLVKRIEYFEKTAEIRTRFQYNNFMLMALGAMAAEVEGGKTWEEQVQERFFKPLQMSHSQTGLDGVLGTADHALPYSTYKDSITELIPFRRIDNMGPAGSISSCANDIANWLITWVNGGKYGDEQIIPAGYCSEAISSQMSNAVPPDASNPELFFSDYGLGWFLSSYRGHYRVEHGGNIDGFTSSVAFFPTDSIGIAIFVNQNGSTVNSILRNEIADMLLGLPDKDWNKEIREQRDKAVKAQEAAKQEDEGPGFGPTHPLADYEGTYTNPGYGKIEVRVEGDSLRGNFAFANLWLKPKNYDSFTACFWEHEKDLERKDFLEVPVIFRINKRGEIAELAVGLEASAGDIVFTKEITELDISPADLEQYVGEYAIGEMVAKIYIKNQNTLCLTVPGQPEYELVPVKKHEFVIRNLKGFGVTFKEDEAGVINALIFNQPNGNFRAEKKQ